MASHFLPATRVIILTKKVSLALISHDFKHAVVCGAWMALFNVGLLTGIFNGDTSILSGDTPL